MGLLYLRTVTFVGNLAKYYNADLQAVVFCFVKRNIPAVRPALHYIYKTGQTWHKQTMELLWRPIEDHKKHDKLGALADTRRAPQLFFIQLKENISIKLGWVGLACFFVWRLREEHHLTGPVRWVFHLGYLLFNTSGDCHVLITPMI
jgi:hypothetical protein